MRVKLLRTKLLLLIPACAALLFFAVSGYLLSDAVFFQRLARRNNISTPEAAFAFVNQNTDYPPAHMNPVMGSTPRYMLTEQKYLYCDQGAILMAAIVNELGYETRLVDLVGDDDISHHTILEVRQQGAWKTYDTAYEMAGGTYAQSAKYYESGKYFHARPVYRTYPGLYNRVIQNNFYLKHLALWLRGLRG